MNFITLIATKIGLGCNFKQLKNLELKQQIAHQQEVDQKQVFITIIN